MVEADQKTKKETAGGLMCDQGFLVIFCMPFKAFTSITDKSDEDVSLDPLPEWGDFVVSVDFVTNISY